MRRWLVALVVLAGVACGGQAGEQEPLTGPVVTPEPGTAVAAAARVHCGTERWAVKTLADRDAASVNLEPQPSSVDALRALPAPAVLPPDRRLGAELVTVTLTADVLEWKLEADSDIHLVIAEPGTRRTMIAESPDAAHCVAATPALRARMAAARAALVARFGQPSPLAFRRLSGRLTLTGVVFLDRPHGQAGVAPNAVELHPILAVGGP